MAGSHYPLVSYHSFLIMVNISLSHAGVHIAQINFTDLSILIIIHTGTANANFTPAAFAGVFIKYVHHIPAPLTFAAVGRVFCGADAVIVFQVYFSHLSAHPFLSAVNY